MKRLINNLINLKFSRTFMEEDLTKAFKYLMVFFGIFMVTFIIVGQVKFAMVREGGFDVIPSIEITEEIYDMGDTRLSKIVSDARAHVQVYDNIKWFFMGIIILLMPITTMLMISVLVILLSKVWDKNYSFSEGMSTAIYSITPSNIMIFICFLIGISHPLVYMIYFGLSLFLAFSYVKAFEVEKVSNNDFVGALEGYKKTYTK